MYLHRFENLQDFECDWIDFGASIVGLEDYHGRVLKYNKYKVDYNFKNN